MNIKRQTLVDYPINIKIKLAALWTAVTLFYLYGDYFELHVPQKVEGLLNSKNLLDRHSRLFSADFILAIPASMVMFSVLLKLAWIKWLNITFGILFTLIMLLIAFLSLVPWREFYVFYALVECIITSIIVWSAIKWPKQ